VGVRQPRAPVRARVVGEADAVLVEQLAGARYVGDDRLVGVDQVRVRGLALRGDRADRPWYLQEAEVAVHLPVGLVDAGAQQRPCALLGAALAPGVVAFGRARLADARGDGVQTGEGAPQRRAHQL